MKPHLEKMCRKPKRTNLGLPLPVIPTKKVEEDPPRDDLNLGLVLAKALILLEESMERDSTKEKTFFSYVLYNMMPRVDGQLEY